jgi:hypothetical protein
MKRRILNSAFATQHRRIVDASLPRLARRLATPVADPSAARLLPLGRLWDPTLLSRLQAPLTRFRE